MSLVNCAKGIFTLMLILASTVLRADVMIMDGYVRATPPGLNNTAAFMVLHNTADEAIALTGAESAAAEHVELHTHQHDKGVMRMRQIEAINLPAADKVSLQPGGHHIMLIGLKQPLISGSEIEMSLHFSDGSRQLIQLPVTSTLPQQPPQHHQHH